MGEIQRIFKKGDLLLGLRKEAHIQTTENFAEGKIATHNTEIDYQQRYDDWKSDFQRDEKKREDDLIIGEEDLRKKDAEAREAYEKTKNGFVEKNVDMDHIIAMAEIIHDQEK